MRAWVLCVSKNDSNLLQPSTIASLLYIRFWMQMVAWQDISSNSRSLNYLEGESQKTLYRTQVTTTNS